MPRVLILIALASLAVSAAGCGSKPTTAGVAQLPSATTTSSSAQATGAPTGPSKAADMGRFSACMRSHGVPKFPDPKSSGNGASITFGSGTGLDPTSPQFKAAQKTCQKLLPNGGKPDPAMQAKAQAQMLKFSACMRAHGLPDFPDPTFSNGGAQLKLGGGKAGGLNPRSPVFQAAQKACQSVMPGPPGGGKGGPTTQSGSGGGKGPSSQMAIAP
jgi:hypothetical protein